MAVVPATERQPNNFATGANSLQTSIGFEGEFDGRDRSSGVTSGGQTDFQAAGYATSYRIIPAFQVRGELNHHFGDADGLRQDIGVTPLTLYAF